MVSPSSASIFLPSKVNESVVERAIRSPGWGSSRLMPPRLVRLREASGGPGRRRGARRGAAEPLAGLGIESAHAAEAGPAEGDVGGDGSASGSAPGSAVQRTALFR